MTRGRFFDVGVKIPIESNGSFDVNLPPPKKKTIRRYPV